MLSVQHVPFITSYPSWLSSSMDATLDRCSPPLDVTIGVPETSKPTRHSHVFAPQPQRPSSVLQHASANECTLRHLAVAAFPEVRPSSPHSNDSYCSTPSISESASTWSSLSDNGSNLRLPPPALRTNSGRIALPLPFSEDKIEHVVAFSSRRGTGVSLAEWARLSEKRKSHFALDDPHEPMDELFAGDVKALFQAHWPGYGTRTRFLELPSHATILGRAFTKADLLDVVCSELLDWVVVLTNNRHIGCREPCWAVGLSEITFRHIYVVAVVRTTGYVPKWVPVVEIDPSAFGADACI